MGVLANHVPSIEQLRPGLVEVIEESGNTKRFFRMFSNKSTLIFEKIHGWDAFSGPAESTVYTDDIFSFFHK